MKTINKIALLILFVFSANALMAQGHDIKVKMKNIAGQKLILGHYFTKQMIPNDTITLNKKGEGAFKADTLLPQGMYIFYLPNKTYFDFIIGSDQQFLIENDTVDFVENFKVTGDKENEVFADYQKFILKQNTKAKELTDRSKAPDVTSKEKKEIEAEYKKMNKEVNAKMDEVIAAYPDLFFPRFLKATREVEVPDEIPQEEKYFWYKDHFFDNFDVSDARLIRTPIYQDKIDRYLDKVIPQMPDSVIPYCDMLIEKSRTSPELFRFMLIHLFNKYAAHKMMCMDKVYIHLAEKYYIDEANWSDPEFIEDLKEKVRRKKPTRCGETAPDIRLLKVPYQHLEESLSDSLVLKDYFYGDFFYIHEVESKYTILIFWEADCSHCRKQMPILKEVYDRLFDKGVEVIAVHMLSSEEGKEKWAKFVTKHDMSRWINAWDPAYQSKYKDHYDISSSPVLFLLDEDKKIIAKRIGPDQVEMIILDFLVNDLVENITDEAEKLKLIKEFSARFDTKKGLENVEEVATRFLDKSKEADYKKYMTDLKDKIAE